MFAMFGSLRSGDSLLVLYRNKQNKRFHGNQCGRNRYHVKRADFITGNPIGNPTIAGGRASNRSHIVRLSPTMTPLVCQGLDENPRPYKAVKTTWLLVCYNDNAGVRACLECHKSDNNYLNCRLSLWVFPTRGIPTAGGNIGIPPILLPD
jgi:hypothetical protein